MKSSSAWSHIKAYKDNQWAIAQERLNGLIETPILQSCLKIGYFWETAIVELDDAKWAEYRDRNRNKLHK
jgi:hypothetical protein